MGFKKISPFLAHEFNNLFCFELFSGATFVVAWRFLN
jgi:pyruvate carboxylase